MKSRKMSKWLVVVASYTKRALFWIVAEKKEAEWPVIKPNNLNINKKVTQEETKSTKTDISNPDDKNKIELKSRKVEIQSTEEEKLAEKISKIRREREEFDSNVYALNYLAFFILLLFIFSCNMGIWISIGN